MLVYKTQKEKVFDNGTISISLNIFLCLIQKLVLLKKRQQLYLWDNGDERIAPNRNSKKKTS